jgi:hypothetical protein
MPIVTRSSRKTDQVMTIQSVVEYVKELNSRESSAKQMIVEGKNILNLVRQERNMLRERAEAIVDGLTPKRQRRRQSDDGAFDGDTQQAQSM